MVRKSITIFDDQYKFFKELKSEKLMIAFIEFMFEWIEPKWLNSLEQTLFDSLRVRMENQKKKSRAGASSHWWWRPPKTTKKQQTKQQKNNKKTTEETTKKQEDILYNNISNIYNNNISNNISNIDNNLVSKDTKWASSSYWDPEINECLEIIKSYNDWIIDWTQKQNRFDARNLILKIKKVPSVADWTYTRQDTLKAILEIISKNKYHSPKITSPGSIYRNLAVLFQVCKQEWWNQIQIIPIL